MINRLIPGALAVALALVLAGCTTDPLAQQYRDGADDSYISGDGSISEFAPEDRGDPIEFEGTTDTGVEVSGDDFAGQVVVVNFWYAGCPPCRAEAPDLQKLFMKHQEDAAFIGVNTYDQPETSQAFARKFKVTYPSIVDADTGKVRLAFAGKAAPSSVPTTIVLDKDGRVAARFLGQIVAPSNLDTIIRELIAEES